MLSCRPEYGCHPCALLLAHVMMAGLKSHFEFRTVSWLVPNACRSWQVFVAKLSAVAADWSMCGEEANTQGQYHGPPAFQGWHTFHHSRHRHASKASGHWIPWGPQDVPVWAAMQLGSHLPALWPRKAFLPLLTCISSNEQDAATAFDAHQPRIWWSSWALRCYWPIMQAQMF